MNEQPPVQSTLFSTTQIAPRLSVLIPTYEHPAGILRIMDSISGNEHANIEFIVGDDSETDAVELAVREHRASLHVQYRRNRPKLGAIQNWNCLLELARGEFVLLLHHDVCPMHPNFFVDLCTALHDPIDALALDCIVGNLRRGRMRRHFPLMLKTLVLRICPSYLLRRNVLGGPSMLVVRRAAILPFDIRFPMMVDVEWYCRLIRQPNFRIRVSDDLSLLTIPQPDSITASFGDAVPAMILQESATIRAENPSLRVLLLNAPRNAAERLLSASESVCWVAVRALTLLVATLLARPIPEYLRSTRI